MEPTKERIADSSTDSRYKAMKTFLFHNSQWMAFQAESLPVMPRNLEPETTAYDAAYQERGRAIADLKAKALPVGNPEIIAEVINRSSKQGGTVFTLVDGIANVFTEWPGTAEKKEESIDCSPSDMAFYKQVYQLSLPKPDMSDKERIEKEAIDKLIKAESKPEELTRPQKHTSDKSSDSTGL